MGNLFGRKKPSRVTEQDKAILQLKQQRDKLRQYQKRVAQQLERERGVARQLLRDGKKERAKLLLKKKRYREQLLDKTENQITSLETMVQSIEFAQIETKVLEGLRLGNECLNRMHQVMSIEEVERILDETQEAVEYQQQIDELLAGSFTQEDEDAILEELNEITQSSSQTSLQSPFPKSTQRKSLPRPGPGRQTWWQPPNSASSCGTGRDSPGTGATESSGVWPALTRPPGGQGQAGPPVLTVRRTQGYGPTPGTLPWVGDYTAPFSVSGRMQPLSLWLPQGHGRPSRLVLVTLPVPGPVERFGPLSSVGAALGPALPSPHFLLLPCVGAPSGQGAPASAGLTRHVPSSCGSEEEGRVPAGWTPGALPTSRHRWALPGFPEVPTGPVCVWNSGAGAWNLQGPGACRPASSELSATKDQLEGLEVTFLVHSPFWNSCCWGVTPSRGKGDSPSPPNRSPPLKLILHPCCLVDSSLEVPAWVTGAPRCPRPSRALA